MNPSDLGDATARALNLLPPGDPASSDPRLARDSQLVEEAKRARETVAGSFSSPSRSSRSVARGDEGNSVG
jgi:hypothetical protein